MGRRTRRENQRAASGARFKEVAVMIGIHDKSLSRALHRGTMSKYYFDKMQELLTVLEAM